MSAYSTYSIINVHHEKDGIVEGTWVQDCIGTLDDAKKRAERTNELNSRKMNLAIVRGLHDPVAHLSIHSGLKRLG